ncbi:MAG TPA: glycoside hydrolase family 3 C-terminal domain-containing protein, partial [Chloroflexia bacterium]|nr:glycoside hydrolase family 3 C-terminal domain-containing protein [Chloroflexia bacterium]
ESPLLPLTAAAGGIALIGAFAREPRYQGAGSSQVTPVGPVENIHDELIALAGADGLRGYAPGYSVDGATDESLLREAQDLARQAEVAVVVVGLPAAYESEGADRVHIDLPPGHNALVEAVLQVQPRVVVVLVNGSAVALPWVDRVPALVEGWLAGQGGGGAIAAVLMGQVNPSGKLAETFPARLADTPAYLSFPHDGTGLVRFGEGLFTGSRWYDARRIEPLFPFGHGLSYTTFAYSELGLETQVAAEGASVTVSLRVRNTGSRAGSEVVQIYVHEQAPHLPRPDKELKAFAKVALDPGEEQMVRFTLGPRDFAIYDPRVAAWTVQSGVFRILVGSSSRDIRLHGSVTVAATPTARVSLNRLSPLRDWLRHPVGRVALLPGINARLEQMGEAPLPEDGNAPSAPINGFIGDMPISKLVMFGALSEQNLSELIAAANAQDGVTF